MTRALVVYESLFGDARTIAQAIADGLSAHLPADAVPAAEAPAEVDADVRLLVVGAPNHAMGMPRQSTREGAAKQHGAQIENPSTGLHEWLDAVRMNQGVPAAAFDTRLDHPKMLTHFDHAARTEEKLLRGHGARMIAPAEHFFVKDAKGPLLDGEDERARLWGQTLAEIATAGARP